MEKVFSSLDLVKEFDTTLNWKGRYRFLYEKVASVSLIPDETKSLNPFQGDNLIIDGDKRRIKV